MKAWIKRMILAVATALPLRKIIIFESNPDYACNTYPVFCEIKQRKEFKKYRLIWLVNQPNRSICKDYILKKPKSLFQKVKRQYYRYCSACVICCNNLVPKANKKQVTLFLTHGSKTKKTRGVYEVGKFADYVMVQSNFFDEIIKYEYNLVDAQLTYCGYPRCDYLYHCDKNTQALFDLPLDARYVIWLPTFRQHKADSRRYMAGSSYTNLGMPIIYDVATLHKLNQFLATHQLYIFYKPHPVQDISGLTKEKLSHILILNDALLAEKGLQLYELISKSSALLTDYSSVYFDYLLLDRPIGTTCDDAEQWKSGRGFAFDLESFFEQSTERIPDYDALIRFLQDVWDGKDRKQKKRNEIKNLTNIFDDGNSAKRVVDFVAQKLNLMEK